MAPIRSGPKARGIHHRALSSFRLKMGLKNLPPPCSQAKLAMRAKAHEFEAVVIRLAVDENEIRSEMAVTVIGPFAGQWVIEIPARQRRVGGEQVDGLHQQGG